MTKNRLLVFICYNLAFHSLAFGGDAPSSNELRRIDPDFAGKGALPTADAGNPGGRGYFYGRSVDGLVPPLPEPHQEPPTQYRPYQIPEAPINQRPDWRIQPMEMPNFPRFEIPSNSAPPLPSIESFHANTSATQWGMLYIAALKYNQTIKERNDSNQGIRDQIKNLEEVSNSMKNIADAFDSANTLERMREHARAFSGKTLHFSEMAQSISKNIESELGELDQQISDWNRVDTQPFRDLKRNLEEIRDQFDASRERINDWSSERQRRHPDVQFRYEMSQFRQEADRLRREFGPAHARKWAAQNLERVAQIKGEALRHLRSSNVVRHFELNPVTREYLQGELDQAEALANEAQELAQAHASVRLVKFVGAYALHTVNSINQFLGGVAGGVYDGFYDVARVGQAIYQNPELISHVSNYLMKTITDPTDFLRNAKDSFVAFTVAMATGTPNQVGHALGHFASNLLFVAATGEVSHLGKVTLEKIGADVAERGIAEQVGQEVIQGIRNTSALVESVQAFEADAARIIAAARKHGIDVVTGPEATLVDKVIIETLEGRGNVTSKFKLTADEALQAGEKWVGSGYKEIGKPRQGVFRSADGRRQFRMDEGSLMGAHDPNVPHIHFQEVGSDGRRFKTNNHVPFEN